VERDITSGLVDFEASDKGITPTIALFPCNIDHHLHNVINNEAAIRRLNMII